MLRDIGLPPIKGQAFRLYFRLMQDDAFDNPMSFTSMTWRIGISKDGAEMVAATNTPVEITNNTGTYVMGEWAYLELTAAEMNADVVCIGIADDGTQSTLEDFVIRTMPSELSSMPSSTSSIAEKITALFQYFFFQREVTASAETMRKEDDSTSLGTNTISDDGTTVTKGRIT